MPHFRSYDTMNRRAPPLLFLAAVGIPRTTSRLPPACPHSPLLKCAAPISREYQRYSMICNSSSPEYDSSSEVVDGNGDRCHRVADDDRQFFRSSRSRDNFRPRNANSGQDKQSRTGRRDYQRWQSRFSNVPRNATQDGHSARMDVDRKYESGSQGAYSNPRTALWARARGYDEFATRGQVNGHSQYTAESRERSSGRAQSAFRNRSDDRRENGKNMREETWDRRSAEPPTELQRALASGDDLLYGLQSVHLALGAGRRDLHALYLQPEGARTGTPRKQGNTRLRAQVVARAEALGVHISERDRGELNVLSGNRPHQGVVLQCGSLDYVPMPGLGKGHHGDVFLALDEVRDPQNVGALLRTAHFLGVKGVAVCQKNSSPITPVVSRASAGAAEVMDVHGVESMPRFLRGAAEKGWRVLGAARERGAVDLGDVLSGPPTVLVLGSEGAGLRTMVRSCCSSLVSIRHGDDCVPEVDSLNVSVAGALALFHLLR